jgi:hypothetical protein
MSDYIITKKAETEEAYIKLCSDGIVRVIFKKDKEIGPRVLKRLFGLFNDFVAGKRYPFIYCAEDGLVVFTNEGNTYSRQNQHVFPKLCSAFVVKSLAQRLIASFYLKFNKPVTPSKVFNRPEEAETWCLAQLKVLV